METAIPESTTLAGCLVVGADARGMSLARHHVHSVASRHFSADEAEDVLIAVGEAISNAYRYGAVGQKNGLIHLEWSFAGRTFTVSVKDDGPGISAGAAAMLRLGIPRRGHGFDIMRQTVDRVRVERNHGTRLVLQKQADWNLSKLSR